MNIVERRYEGSCTIENNVMATDSLTNITRGTWTTVLANEPCRLDVENVSITDVTSGAPKVSQVCTLFMTSQTVVTEGSRITVTQNGRTDIYRASGKPAVYPSHQEIPITLEKEYA